MSALTRFIASVGALAAAFALSLFPIPAHAQLLWEGQHAWTTEAVTFSSDSKTLISGSDDETVRLWDVDTESLIATIEVIRPDVSGSIRSVRFSPDGSLFATADGFDTVTLWSTAQWITETTSISDETLPAEVSLAQNYPNPFNPATTIGFELPVSTDVRLDVYDITGRQLSTLVNGIYPSGYHTVRWDATGLPTGIYAYRLITGAKQSPKQ